MARVAILLISVTLIAGLTPLAARYATAEFPPMLIPLPRFGIAGFLLAVTARLLGLWRPIPRGRWLALMGLGLLCVPINQIGYLVGIKKANASHAGIAYALVPVLVFWITVVLGRARAGRKLAIASVLAFGGAALVSLTTSNSARSALEAKPSMLMGDLLLVSAAVSWSFFVVLSQPLVRELGAVTTLCVVFLLGTLWHIPVAGVEWLAGGANVSFTDISWRAWSGLAYLTLITAYLNYLLWYVVTARYDITRSAVVTNAHFLVTVGAEAALFGYSVGPPAIVGSLLLLAGIVLATRTPPTPSKIPDESRNGA